MMSLSYNYVTWRIIGMSWNATSALYIVLDMYYIFAYYICVLFIFTVIQPAYKFYFIYDFELHTRFNYRKI